MADSKILREYLVSLGYKVNKTQKKEFDKGLEASSAKALKLGKALVGVAVAAQGMVSVFALQMEKLYYATRRASSTASEMKALGQAGKMIGVGAEALQDAVGGIVMKMRTTPGLREFTESLGVPTKGKTGMQVALGVLDKLKQMEFPIAAVTGQQMYGIDPDMLFQMLDNLDTLHASIEKQLELDKQLGSNSEAATKAGLEYARSIHEITASLGRLYDAASIKLLPFFQSMSTGIQGVINDLVRLVNTSRNLSELDHNLSEYLGSFFLFGPKKKKPLNYLLDQARELYYSTLPPEKAAAYRAQNEMNDAAAGVANSTLTRPRFPSSSATMDAKARYMADRERQYGLPPGTLDYMWKTESGRGANMGPSSAGATGNFQWMPGTAQQYGVTPGDFYSEANGAAQYVGKYFQQYGDIQRALAAYHSGPEAVKGDDWYSKLGPQGKAYAGGFTQQNTFIIQGNDPNAIANAVASKLDEREANVSRDLTGAVQ